MAEHSPQSAVTAADIIAELGGDLRSGMCRCPCPAHDDTNPSLHVSEPGGKILADGFRCPQEDVIAALKQRDLWGATANTPSHRQPRRAEGARRIRETTPRMDDPACGGFIRPAAGKIPGSARHHGIPAAAMVLPPKERERLTGKRYPAMVSPSSLASF